MTRIALMRHFPTDWNEAHRLQGRVDRPLTDAALSDLSRLRPPAPWDAAPIIATPLRRTSATAKALTGRAPDRIEPRLIELSWGEWEGRRGADLIADPASGYAHVEDWGWERRPPGGESPADAWARIRPALAAIATEGRESLLIVHRGVMRVIFAKAWGWNFDRPEPFGIKRSRIYPLTLGPDGAPTAPEEALRLLPRG